MKELKDALTEDTLAQLRAEISAGTFPGITFQLAMEFALTDGIIPADGLPVESFLRLEDWLRARLQ